MKLMENKYIRRSKYWEWFFKQQDYRELFLPIEELSLTRQRTLFRKYVHVINVETSSFCNRKCNYCPLSQIDRTQHHMPEEIFSAILTELSDCRFGGHISLNLYIEPLLDVHLKERIAQIKERLPKAWVKFDSNGDYLSLEVLDELIDAGLDSLLISRHEEAGKFDVRNLKDKTSAYVRELGLGENIENISVSEGCNVTIRVLYRGREILVCANHWEKIGNDRGGSVRALSTENVRVLPCPNPIREVVISYDGKMKPCCNIYFGNHTDYGTIMDEGILHTYFEALREFRLDLLRFGEKQGGCARCSTEDNAAEETRKLREEIWQKYR